MSFDRNGITDLADSPIALAPIPASYGYAGILLSVCFFQSLNQLIVWIGCPRSVGRENVWKWRNLVVSWTHAVIVGIWDITCFYRYPELLNDLVGYYNMYIYSMVAFSAGYFIHDLIDIVVNRQSASMWEVIPHHIAVAGMFVGNFANSYCIAYSVIALLAEVNTIFLHSRKLLQMLGVNFESPLYRANAAVNLVTFLCCRFVCIVWIGYGIVVDGNRVGALYIVAAYLSMIVMCPINAVLFWRLLCSDVLGRRRSRRKTSDAGVDGQPATMTGTAFRILASSSVPVSVEDVRLTCCPPTDSVGFIGRSSSDCSNSLNGNVTLVGSASSVGSITFSDCHRRLPLDDIIAMTGFQTVTQ